MKLNRIWAAVVFSLFSLLSLHAAAPAMPGNARPAWVDGFSVVLTWDEVPEADLFTVYRFDAGTGNWQVPGADLITPMFREVPPHEPPLQYAITASNADGESAAAIVSLNEGGFPTTTVMVTPPGWNPGTLTETNALISFVASIVSGTDCLLEIGTDAAELGFYKYQPEYAGWHNFTVTNLAPGTEYFYRLTYSETNRLGMTYVGSFVTLPMNHAPQAQDVTVQQAGEYETAIPLTGSDPDYWQWLSVRITTPPTKGAITAVYETGTGTWTAHYQPNAGARGTDSFQFVISDGQLESAPATVTINGICMNDAPTATDAQVETAEDTAAAVVLQASDPDGDALSYSVVSVSEGTISGTIPNLSWMPPSNFNGTSWITYRVSDGYEHAYGTVQITVTPVNDEPVAVSLMESGIEDAAMAIVLEGTDRDGDTLTYEILMQPEHGVLSGVAPNLLYTPAPNYNGVDGFTYRVSDGTTVSEIASAIVDLAMVNDAPVGVSSNVITSEDSAALCVLNASDIDGDAVSFAVVSQPQSGVLGTIDGNTVLYSPNLNFYGNDSFQVQVTDGVEIGNILTVSVSVAAVNDAPAANDLSITTAYNSPVSVTLSGSDLEGGALNYTVVTGPSNGTLGGTTPNLTLTPAIGWSGTTSFTYRVDDGELDSEIATVVVTVTPATSAPSAPGNLDATAVSRNQIDLSWDDTSDNEDGFQIERYSGGWVMVGTAGPNVRTFSVTGLNANRNYTFRARAFNTVGNSGYSNSASAKTLK